MRLYRFSRFRLRVSPRGLVLTTYGWKWNRQFRVDLKTLKARRKQQASRQGSGLSLTVSNNR